MNQLKNDLKGCKHEQPLVITKIINIVIRVAFYKTFNLL